jgi:hypothetical protein
MFAAVSKRESVAVAFVWLLQLSVAVAVVWLLQLFWVEVSC